MSRVPVVIPWMSHGWRKPAPRFSKTCSPVFPERDDGELPTRRELGLVRERRRLDERRHFPRHRVPAAAMSREHHEAQARVPERLAARAGAGRLGPWSLGPWSLGPWSLGPWSLGPWSLGPWSLGPRSLGPRSLGPRSLGPRSLGPWSLGPWSLGPWSLGPWSLGPWSLGPWSLG
eukprot:gene2391-biopygen18532